MSDTALGVTMAAADAELHEFPITSLTALFLLIYSVVQAFFAKQFLRAALKMRSDVLPSLQRKLGHAAPLRENLTNMATWLAVSGVFMLLVLLLHATSAVILLLTPFGAPDEVTIVVFAALRCYFRVGTSFAQVMSLRAVPNRSVDEVLVGRSRAKSQDRQLPRWLLLNREFDRIGSCRHVDGAVDTTQNELAAEPGLSNEIAEGDDQLSTLSRSESSKETSTQSSLRPSRPHAGANAGRVFPALRAKALGSSRPPPERQLTRHDIEQMFPDSPLAEMCKTGRLTTPSMLGDRGARAATASIAAASTPADLR